MPAWGLKKQGCTGCSLEPRGWYRCPGKVRCTLATCCTVSGMCSGCLSNCCNTGPLSLAGQYRTQANQITEALPPEVKVKDDLSLPPAINSYPFSSFIKSHFQVGTLFISLHCFPTGDTLVLATPQKNFVFLSFSFLVEDRFPWSRSASAAPFNPSGR